jgi:two-component system chemotaxis response regulator CheY
MNKSITALIVDDSESMRLVVTETLKSAGYKIAEAVNGAEALKLAQTGHFDLVITDINMPVMDGFELIEQLRSLPAYKHIPILALTTESRELKKQSGKKAGATGWVTKPFSPDKLLAVLSRLVGDQHTSVAV